MTDFDMAELVGDALHDLLLDLGLGRKWQGSGGLEMLEDDLWFRMHECIQDLLHLLTLIAVA
jgi:hypothetical protein